MNVPDTIRHLTAKDETTGEYVIPHIIYSDAYASEMVHYADLILPDTTYLERWDCISLLDRPISEADGPADSIRQPVVEPDRDVRPFQDCAARSRRAARACPAWCATTARRAIPAAIPTTSSITSAHRALVRLAGWRGAQWWSQRQGRAQSRSARALYREWLPLVPGTARPDEILPARQLGLSRLGDLLRISWPCRSDRLPALLRALAEIPPRGAKGRAASCRPQHRERIVKHFDPIPFWYPPLSDEALDVDDYPMHAITQRPMAMYHSWGSQNAWLRQILGRNWLYIHHAARRRTRHRRWRLGPRHLRPWPHQGAGEAHGRRQSRHRLDLERDRQEIGRLGASHRMRRKRKKDSCSIT